MLDLDDLYSRYAADVRRFALYLTGDVALADDITSETFLRAWSSVGRIREATVKAYLFTIVRNLYLLEIRRSSRHVELQDAFPSRANEPERHIDQQAAVAIVFRALRTLPEVDRAALLMRAQINPAPTSDHEKTTLERVRRFNRYRSYVLGLSLALTMLPFSFAFVEDGVNWMMLRDNPRQAMFLWIAAVACWGVYYATGRRLRTPAP